MTGKSAVNANTWFEKVNAEGVVTRQAADPLNVTIWNVKISNGNSMSAAKLEKLKISLQ